MIWLFERGDRVARVVTRVDADSGEYILDLEWSDGLNEPERYSQLASFRARILALEQQLLAEDWISVDGSPQLIAADWWKP
jgi:hypothetical protein